MGAADEFVGAVAAPADLLAEFGRGIGHHAVFGIKAGLLAKAAADIADQHAHAFLWPLQDRLGQQVAGRARRLRLGMQDQPAGFLFDLGNGRARLHRRGNQALAEQIERHFVRGLRKRFLDLGGIAIAHGGNDVVGRIRPHHRRARLDRLERIDHRRQHLVVDLDRFGRASAPHPRGRDHGRHRLAGKAHDLVREQTPRRHRHRLAVRPHEHRQRRQRADIVPDQIGAGVDALPRRAFRPRPWYRST